MRLFTTQIRAWPVPISTPETRFAPVGLLLAISLPSMVMSAFFGVTLSTSRIADRALPEIVRPVR
jgi:hypothetical protein